MERFFSYLPGFEILLLGLLVMTGILALIREIFGLYEPDSRQQRWLFWACVRVAFMLAAGWLWVSEHRQVLDLQDKLNGLAVSRLGGGIDAVSASPTSDKDALLVITAHITNLGAPSIVEFSGCKVSALSGKEAIGEFGPIPAQLAVSFGSGKVGMIYSREDNLLVKGSAAPIATGGAIAGWLYVGIHGLSAKEVLQPGTLVTLTTKDVRGQSLLLSHTITTDNTHESFPQFFPEYLDAPKKERLKR